MKCCYTVMKIPLKFLVKYFSSNSKNVFSNICDTMNNILGRNICAQYNFFKSNNHLNWCILVVFFYKITFEFEVTFDMWSFRLSRSHFLHWKEWRVSTLPAGQAELQRAALYFPRSLLSWCVIAKEAVESSIPVPALDNHGTWRIKLVWCLASSSGGS